MISNLYLFIYLFNMYIKYEFMWGGILRIRTPKKNQSTWEVKKVKREQITLVKKIKREQITLGAKNAQGDSEVDRSRSGMHFSSIPMDVGAQFFRRNDIHTHTGWKDIDKEVILGSASRSIRCQYGPI